VCLYTKRCTQLFGHGVAFGWQADFSGISPKPVWIDRVQHRISLEVDEKGTEAAAATSVTLTLGADISPPSEFLMVFDHPFFCVIHDRKSGGILFTAAIVDPE